MIVAFAGDPFLSERAAANYFREQGIKQKDINILSEDLDAVKLSELLSQSSLFGQTNLLLNFDTAFKGKSGVKPRNDVLKVLESKTDALVVIVDQKATASREKIYKRLGEYHKFSSPRFGALISWIRQELKAEGIKFTNDVPNTLADIFGEDLPSIAAEIQKLKSIDYELNTESIRTITNRPASRDAFDLIEATANGQAKNALLVCRSLFAQGESAARVLGALSWQYNIVAKAVALLEDNPRADGYAAARELKVQPYVAKKSMAIAKKLDEDKLKEVLKLILDADLAIKTGKNEKWALESLALELCDIFSTTS